MRKGNSGVTAYLSARVPGWVPVHPAVVRAFAEAVPPRRAHVAVWCAVFLGWLWRQARRGGGWCEAPASVVRREIGISDRQLREVVNIVHRRLGLVDRRCEGRDRRAAYRLNLVNLAQWWLVAGPQPALSGSSDVEQTGSSDVEQTGSSDVGRDTKGTKVNTLVGGGHPQEDLSETEQRVMRELATCGVKENARTWALVRRLTAMTAEFDRLVAIIRAERDRLLASPGVRDVPAALVVVLERVDVASWRPVTVVRNVARGGVTRRGERMLRPQVVYDDARREAARARARERIAARREQQHEYRASDRGGAADR